MHPFIPLRDLAFWVAALVGLWSFLRSVTQLGVQHQRHHAWALVLCFVPVLPLWILVTALVVGYDDVIQHWIQAHGHPSFRSPVNITWRCLAVHILYPVTKWGWLIK